jgi:hypothetical protein
LPSPATKRARDLQKKAVALSCNQRARDLQKALKAGAPVIFQFRVNYRGRFWEIFFNELSTAVHTSAAGILREARGE